MVKCREFGSIGNVAVAIAVGVNDEGTRKILGVEVFTSEDETALRALTLRSSKEQEQSGIFPKGIL